MIRMYEDGTSSLVTLMVNAFSNVSPPLSVTRILTE